MKDRESMTPCEKWRHDHSYETAPCDCQTDPYHLQHCLGCNSLVDCSLEDSDKETWCWQCWKVEKLERQIVAERTAHFFSALAAVGYTVVTGLKMVEYKEEARRCRRIVKGMMDGLDVSGVAVEHYGDPKSGVFHGVVVCAPNLNEENLGEAMKVVLEEYWAWHGGKPEGTTIGPMRSLGTESGS